MTDPPASKKLKTIVPKKLKLYYGDMNFWRAECIRMAFFMGDVPFEDIRDSSVTKQLKEDGKLTFGAIPVLEVIHDDEGGSKMLSQTQAIATYAAKLSNLYPPLEDYWTCAKVDEIINGCTDVTTTISTTFRIKDDQEKINTRKTLIDSTSNPPGRLWMHLNGLNKICSENNKDAASKDEGCGGYFGVGSTLTIADLAIWRLMGWIDSGKVDGIPMNYGSDTFPALAKLVAAVNAEPKVQQWKNKHPKFYSSSEEKK